MRMTQYIICYIKKKALCVETIAEATGVQAQMLSGQCSRSFSASEMLEICNYLKVDPYDLWNEEWDEEKLSEGEAE